MPIKSVKLIPGVNVEKTPTLNEAGISQSAFGRFRDGLFQKIGGWAQYFFYNAGIPRALHAWQDLNSLGHLAVGTTSSFGVITSGAVNVLTPQQLTTNPAVNFSTVSGTKLVTVIDASLTGVTTIYDGVYFNTPISVGGLILSGFYSIVVPIASATSYTITASKNATATVNNAGAVPTFTTVSGSAVVTVNLTAHGLVNNDTINFPISTTANGVVIVGSYVATVASDANTFTITGSAQATANGTVSMNGAAAQLLYTITAGPAAAGAAYGTGVTAPVTFVNGSSNIRSSSATLPITVGTPCSFTFSLFVTFTNGSANITNTDPLIPLPTTTNAPVTFLTTSGLPTNFAINTTYYILAGATTSLINVSASPSGAAVVAGSAGSGDSIMSYITTTGALPTNFAPLTKSVTFTNSSANISGSGLPTTAGALVTFTGAVPIGFDVGNTYYILSGGSSSTITVSASVGGTAIVARSAGGSGTMAYNNTFFTLPAGASSVTFTNSSANITGVVSDLPTTVNTPVTFTGSVPTGFTVGTTYYILTGASSSTITVSLTVGGAAVVAGGAGSGVMAYSSTSSVATLSNANGGAAVVAGSAGSGTHTLNIGFGSGTYGFGITPGTQTGTPISATNWTIDNWGQDVVACPAGGGIYYWNPTGGFTTLVNILTAPVFNEGIFVSMPQQILVAYGSTVAQNIGVQQDPLLVAWSDIGDFEAWTPLTTNQAGSYRIPTGSKIVGGIQGPQNGLIWTDLDMWSMNYLGYPLVFGFTKVGANCGLAGKHAACQLGGNVYWMGQSNFFMFGGSGVQVIPCPIWDYVFQNVDTANIYKTVACANTSFNEVWWFFPASAGSGEPNRYVKYNTLERTWDYGVLSRTAWIDQSVLGPPIAASPDSYIWQHETTEDAAGTAIVSSMQTGYFVVNEAHEKTFIDLIWPDFKYGLYGGSQGASIQVTVYGADYPTDTPTAFGPFTMNSTTQYINLRMRARLVAMKFESSDLGSFWRIGNVRVRYAQDGKV